MKLFKRLSMVAVAAALIATSAFAGNASQAEAAGVQGKVVVAGSTALLPLTLQASKEFKQKNPLVSISASGAGSVTGPQSVGKGIAQIGACDWDASTDVPGFKAFNGMVAHKVAVIPFATIVNKNVSVSNLTGAQLQEIFSGKITNWKQVGGSDAPIIVVNRAFGSGTRVNYQVKALGGGQFMKSGANYKEVKSSGDMYTAVSTTPNSIGFIDLVYVKGDVKALNFNGVAPTVENVIAKKYPIWSYGYFMTKGQPTGATKAFIDYVQSAQFQQGSLKKMKFIPITSMK
ncbi:phosphate ABC transporter substrate-binding protein [Brevibacillus ginsengisoli]|uniref:phosphate ABC transporter substrate-binding protein n=1 Tax=Brevibacillus ginsengisoli TaxID=363854 RepID=UPI003CF3F3B1